MSPSYPKLTERKKSSKPTNRNIVSVSWVENGNVDHLVIYQNSSPAPGAHILNSLGAAQSTLLDTKN